MLDSDKNTDVTLEDLEWMFAEYYFSRPDIMLPPGDTFKLPRTDPNINAEYVKFILEVFQLPKQNPLITENNIRNWKLGHSFIMYKGEIYSEAQKGAILGAGTFGTIKKVTARDGRALALKMQISGTNRDAEELKDIEKEEEFMKILGRYKAEFSRASNRKRNKVEREIKQFALDKAEDQLSDLVVRKNNGDLSVNEEEINEVKSQIKQLKLEIEYLGKTFRKTYTLMEFIEGKNLADYYSSVSPDDFNSTQKLILGIKLCQQIEALHELGILHRDIKPQNIMTDIHGNNITVIPIDFGLSEFFSKGQAPIFSPFLIGTPAFMAPEIFEKGLYMFESDQFAVGKTFESLGFEEKYWMGLVNPDYTKRENLNTAIWNMVKDLEQQPNLDEKTVQFIKQTKVRLFTQLLNNSEIIPNAGIDIKNWEMRGGYQLVSKLMSKNEAENVKQMMIDRFGKEIFKNNQGIVNSREHSTKFRVVVNFEKINEYLNAHDFAQDFAKGPVKPLKRRDVSLKEDPSEKRASPLLAIKPIEKQALKIEKDKVQKVAAAKKPSPDKNQRPKLSK